MKGLDMIVEEKLCEDIKIKIASAEFYARICGRGMTIYGSRFLEKDNIQHIFSGLLNYAKSRGLNRIELDCNNYYEFEEILDRLGFKTIAYDDYNIRYLKNL